jgi:hypothetical protein
MSTLYEASNNIIALERPHKPERIHACCVNFRTVRQGGKVSIFKRLKYAFNPLPMNWRTTYSRLTHENESLEYLLFVGIAVIIGQCAVMLKLFFMGDI